MRKASGKRIAFLVHNLAPYGSSMVLRDLLGQAIAGGDDCLVITTDPIPSPSIELPAGVPVISLNRQHTGPFGLLAASIGLARVIRRERVTAVLGFLPYGNICSVLGNLLALRPASVIATEHNTPDPYRSTQRVLEFMCRLTYPRADGVVAVSNSVADDVTRAYHLPTGSVRTIYNPLDLEGIQQQAAEANPHPWLSENRSQPVLVSVGRLTEHKGQDLTLRALAETELLSTRVIFVGDGETRESLAKLAGELGITERVSFAGFHSNPYSFIARADALVHSTRREGFGLVLVEAALLNVPVVASAVGGIPELLPTYVRGRLVEPDDVRGLAEAVAAVLNDGQAHQPSVALSNLALKATWSSYRKLLFQ